VETLAQAFLERSPTNKHDSRTRPRPDLALYVRFAAYTGLRAGEIGALRVKNVDLRGGLVHVREAVSNVGGRMIVGTPKTKAGTRTVGLPPSLIPELRNYLGARGSDPEAFIFVGERGGQFLHSNFYGRHWKAAVKAAALPDELRFHDLRHTYASFLVRAGVHPKEMSVLLGHASAQLTLDRYSHMWDGTEIEVAARLDQLRRESRSDQPPTRNTTIGNNIPNPEGVTLFEERFPTMGFISRGSAATMARGDRP
jgi:integrase